MDHLRRHELHVLLQDEDLDLGPAINSTEGGNTGRLPLCCSCGDDDDVVQSGDTHTFRLGWRATEDGGI